MSLIVLSYVTMYVQNMLLIYIFVICALSTKAHNFQDFISHLVVESPTKNN